MTEPDPYADVPPPRADDGPQRPVNDTELEEERHPEPPEGEQDGESS